MVNLDEILESEKKAYVCPVMVVKKINFSDIIVTSPTGDEDPANNVFGDGNLGDLEVDDQGAGK